MHRRGSVRLPVYDYASPGAYFITIVTNNRVPFFGAVAGGEMRLSPHGHVAQACWRAIPRHFPHVQLGTFIVMPNHVHGILILHGQNGFPVGAHHGAPLPPRPTAIPQTRRASLGAIIRQYKSTVTREITRQFGGPARPWQRNYYEHIIRDETEWDRLRRYIESNPMNWDDDEENPQRRAT